MRGRATGLLAYYGAIGGAARRAALRHRRRRLQGQRPRAAGAARLRLARAALRDRAQVPGRGNADRGARHRRAGRPHRRDHAGGAAEAGVRRRRHRDQRDAAQRGRGPAQGRARRRHRRRAARRRRHPRGRPRRGRTAARAAREPLRACRQRCPECGSAIVAPARRGGRALHRRPRLPGAAQAGAAAFRRRGARMDIEGLGDKLVDQLVDAGLVAHAGRPLRAGRRARSPALDRMAEKSAANVVAAIEASRQHDAGALRLSRWASATSARRRRATWRGTSAASTR